MNLIEIPPHLLFFTLSEEQEGMYNSLSHLLSLSHSQLLRGRRGRGGIPRQRGRRRGRQEFEGEVHRGGAGGPRQHQPRQGHEAEVRPLDDTFPK